MVVAIEMAMAFGLCLIASLVSSFVVGKSIHVFLITLAITLTIMVWYALVLPAETMLLVVLLLFAVFLSKGDSYE